LKKDDDTMSSQLPDEQLSALVDGELPHEQLDLLLARVDTDGAIRSRLARYSLIGECLRGTPAPPESLFVADRVRTALLAENTAMVSSPRAPTWRMWATAGLAAAAALVAILVAGPETRRSGPAASMAAASTPPESFESLDTISVPARAHRLDPRSAERVTGYLMAHGEYANRLARNSLDSHLVTAGAERIAWLPNQGATDAR
jgi:sigma-E factor negative regulatory protein RseA